MRSKNLSVCRLTSFVLGISIIVLLANGSALANLGYQQGNSITGFVFAPDRKPVPLTNVELLDEFSRIIARTRTEGSGRYVFRGLSAGVFRVRVQPYETNYEEQVQQVEIINFTRSTPSGVIVSGQNSEQLDFYLRPYKKAGQGATSNSETVFAQEVPAMAQKVFEKSLSLLDNKKDEEAIQKLQEAITIFPDYYLALERLGREYLKQEKYEAARDVLSKAVRINERGYSGWYELGYANFSLNKFDETVTALEKAVAGNIPALQAYLILGVSHRRLKHFELAEKNLLKAKELANETMPKIHWELALLYAYNLKRYSQAADELELFLKSQPESRDSAGIRAKIKELRDTAANQK